MLSTERKLYLLQKVEREGTIHVRDVAKQLNISETTIRRDLMELEQEGKVRRVHGGAVRESLNQILTESRELLMQDRMLINFDRKSRICRSASELVEDGECVFLDGGTSIVAMIDYLQSRPIKIVTHNQLIVQRLHDPVAQIIIIGGDFNAKYHMSEGPMEQNMLGLYNFDRAFIGCAGMDPISGQCYTAEMGTRELKEIAMKNSNHSYLLIDDSKLFVKGFCKFTNADAFEQIFCNRLDETVENLPENMKFVE